MEVFAINEIKNILPWFMKQKTVWANYDEEADVLYLHFKKHNHADHSELTDDDMIIRYENNEIIRVTVLNVSKK